MSGTTGRRTPPAGARRGTPSRWLAAASLLLGIAAFLVGSGDMVFASEDLDSYSGGADPLSFRIMLFAVLPIAVGGVLLGILAVQFRSMDDAEGRLGRASSRTGSMAWAGLLLSALVVVLALAGAFLMFLGMAGPD